ncbi:ras GEF [Terfezia boudieri ATCC MYA-4762]|uniref:Ras GEF n=1 Tax=Terfezia boudieri ATCC MYA-4762 TaxID=1051890 RepID=A0A3N4M6L8_9PEZI|nr:ras GEF [Terfezia boudieri ATCC MYA-4762]
MTDQTDYAPRASVSVAPLHIVKAKRSSSGASRRARTHSRNPSQSLQTQSSQHHITPPPTPTPHSPDDGFTQQGLPPSQPPRTVRAFSPSDILMHHFLRAFFPFHPTLNKSSNTVTLPLNIGDIILVHSVHTNGWADGTMLSSGARGWLPTNYCEGYDLEQVRPLLGACLSLFDQCKGGGSHQGGNQGVVTGVVTGVRYLLETTECLTREAPNVQANDRIRRHRKLLLSDLSSLVKAAKRIPDHAINNAQDFITAEDIIDEMVLRTFKIVVRGVGFLDSWYEELQANLEEILLYGRGDECNLPTPSESVSPSVSSSLASLSPSTDRNTIYNNDHRFSVRDNHHAQSTSFPLDLEPKSECSRSETPRAPSASSIYGNNIIVEVQRQPAFALARLDLTHDTLLSHLASYIGGLEARSRSPGEIKRNTKKSASAAQDLLAVVEAVHRRDPGAIALEAAKQAMYARITALVNTALEVINSHPESTENNDEGVIVRSEGKKLMVRATRCVKGAGECVAKAKFVIERIGDFELDLEVLETGYEPTKSSSASIKEVEESEQRVETELEPEKEEETVQPVAVGDRELMPPPPLPAKDKPIETDKPLPLLPLNTSIGTLDIDILAPLSESPDSPERLATSHSRSPSIRSVLDSTHSLTKVVSSEEIQVVQNIRKRDAEAKAAFERSFRADSVGASSAATNSTYQSNVRDSEMSIISPTSTRATSPEPSIRESTPAQSISGIQSCSASIAGVSVTGSEAEEEPEVVTYAHELTFNKEGCISGGSLSALVERLTVHDSTPDAIFVSTFYLTFRLFTTPKEFAEHLVARFDSVTASSKIGTPVRLRVYNVFKGWMESHWRKDCDSVALDTINTFAAGRLSDALPGAGKRLADLAVKVSSVDGPLVPRLVSSMGKTNTATAQYTVPDGPVPSPVISRSQLNLLRSSVSGNGNQPTILDFDPLELARQFTLKESRMFCSILPEELIAQEWTKKSGSLAVNVRAMSALSTDLAHLVAETILAQEDSKRRAVVIKQWIKIADRCLELNNYDSLMAIMCTMNASTIIRLKKTWELVSAKTKQVLEHLRSVIDVSKNHAVLRARLRGHVPPCLPFLGTYLTDLTFVDVGNPSKRPLTSEDGTTTKQLINFDKHTKTARIISELQRFQIPYRITEVPELQQWIDGQVMRIRTSKAGDVQTLYRRSLLLEPRESSAPPTPAVETPPAAPSLKDKFSWSNITSKSSTAAISPSSSSISFH